MKKMFLSKLINETRGMEGDTQHGFRPNHSTLSAFLELKSAIAKGLDDGKIAIQNIGLKSLWKPATINHLD